MYFSSSLYNTRTALVSQVASVYTVLDGRTHALEHFTESLNIRANKLEQFSASIEIFSASLNNTYATDVELATTTSNLNIDMGEF